MILYPAIDLKDGQCVRLLRGEMTAATVFGDDPAAQAAAFQAAGCDWLHLVDLNGAFAGTPGERRGGRGDPRPRHRALPAGRRHPRHGHDRSLARARPRPRHPRHGRGREPGTGARGRTRLPRPGRRRHRRPQGPCRDARLGGRDRVQATDLARSFEDAGVAAVIYTDIDRDGAMQGPNIAATDALARAVTIPVIASGGVSSHGRPARPARHRRDRRSHLGPRPLRRRD